MQRRNRKIVDVMWMGGLLAVASCPQAWAYASTKKSPAAQHAAHSESGSANDNYGLNPANNSSVVPTTDDVRKSTVTPSISSSTVTNPKISTGTVYQNLRNRDAVPELNRRNRH